MDQQPNEKKNSKARAHAVAGWEWFKEAAWLQVLLIVGLVVGIVVSIPYIVSAVKSAVDNNESGFYSAHNINYDQFNKMLDGKDKNNSDGVIGNNSTNFGVSEDKTGFVVMFYKDNCENCKSMQEGMENWYNDYNSKYANGKLKFYTINAGWRPGSETDSQSYQGTDPDINYQNTNITLQQQYDVQQAIKSVYLEQDSTHQNTSVTEDTLNTRLDTYTGGGTLPTPTFLTYTRDKTSDSFKLDSPAKVICGLIGSLSSSSYSDIAAQMSDIFLFQNYKA